VMPPAPPPAPRPVPAGIPMFCDPKSGTVILPPAGTTTGPPDCDPREGTLLPVP
jgi:hypothetical protein